MPREALREALLNACINKDYAEPSPIQIRVYENKLEIINGGRWGIARWVDGGNLIVFTSKYALQP